MEKDDQMVPRIKLDQDLPTSRMGRPNYGMQSRSLEHLDIMQESGPRGQGLPEGKRLPSSNSLSLSPGALRLSDLALNNGLDGTYRRGESLASGEFVSRSRSTSYVPHSHSGTSSSTSTDMVVNGGNAMSGSHSGTSASLSHSNTALHYNVPSSLSSLGYGSNDSSSLDSHSLNHTHRHTPYTSRTRPAGPSEMEVVHRDMPDLKPSKTALGRSSSFTSRPSSLSLTPKTSGAPGTSMGGKAQYFYCPNCKKSFSCAGKDSFDSWFDHVKFCNA